MVVDSIVVGVLGFGPRGRLHEMALSPWGNGSCATGPHFLGDDAHNPQWVLLIHQLRSPERIVNIHKIRKWIINGGLIMTMDLMINLEKFLK